MRMRTSIFAGIVLAVVSIAGLASADGNAPKVHLTVSRATSDCKDPGSGAPPPNSGFHCSYPGAANPADLTLVLNKPVETKLPDGRVVQFVWTGNDSTGRFKVNAFSSKAGNGAFIQFATITVKPNDLFGVNFPYAGKPNDAMFVNISIN